MTDKLRAAAQAALEALVNDCDWRVRSDAANGLRAALAEDHFRVFTKMIEPVAWSHNLIDNIIRHRPTDIDRHPDRWTPLYTAPPRREWVGLTAEETRCLGDKLFGFYPGPDGPIVQLVRAVEAALKEKNFE